MPLNKAIKDRIEEVARNYELEELDLGSVEINDLIDDFNFIIDSCSNKPPVYTECVKQLERLGNDGVIDLDDKNYAISQLFS
jgi:septation ring formation regulator EzrA